MVVEDEKKVASFIQRGLEEEEFTVDVAHDGEEGVTIAGSVSYDLILMDVNLPGMNGLQAMKRLRNTPETRLIPIIALTSNSTPQNIEAGLNAGFDGYLTKPIVVSELMKAIQKTLDNITDPI